MISPEALCDIERFHQLASQSRDAIEQKFSAAEAQWLQIFIETQLSDTAQPIIDSADQFADVILVLGKNKKVWSQRLGSLIADLAELPVKDDSLQQLEQFADECPWRFLQESARRKIHSKWP